MRMFLIVMCDIFLILYLTSITNVQPRTFLTVEDFYKLKSMNATLRQDKQKAEEELRARLDRERQEREALAARLAAEKDKAEELEQSLVLSDAQREQINKDLQAKEKMLKAREKLLADLNREIQTKEKARRQMEAAYRQQLQSQEQTLEMTRKEADRLQAEAQEAQRLADQMKQEAELAFKTAETAQTIRKQADKLKDQALQDKAAAEERAEEALDARRQAEAAKQKAMELAQAAQAKKAEAEAKAKQLVKTVRAIKQDAESAYAKISPRLQVLHVTYERGTPNATFEYERELTLLPVKIDGQIYGVFPSKQIGFLTRSDDPPDKLVIAYQGNRVRSAWINKGEDLIAIPLPGYQGEAQTPHPPEARLDTFMPTLLSLRNNGNVGLLDSIRGISDHYFIVKRDDLENDEAGYISYAVTGIRGTGTHAERIVRGDQLVDLTGRLIGIAGDVNRVIRFTDLSGWEELNF